MNPTHTFMSWALGLQPAAVMFFLSYLTLIALPKTLCLFLILSLLHVLSINNLVAVTNSSSRHKHKILRLLTDTGVLGGSYGSWKLHTYTPPHQGKKNTTNQKTPHPKLFKRPRKRAYIYNEQWGKTEAPGPSGTQFSHILHFNILDRDSWYQHFLRSTLQQ